ncbi:hypothetical protein ACFX2J_004862 [Malus domestica]|uniref:RRM domain-containing protein n=1 Tax=Malus domestica TaxID=3750 RepID=A0A498IX45_MALDO|nr:hypothetical protein DVH24_017325 [Malus domestica]
MDFSKKRKTEPNGTVSTSPPSQSAYLTPEDARRLLQPLTQDQLIGILQNAVVRHPDVLESVRSVADQDSTLRKLFIRGLGADTTSDSLRSLFSAFGELDEAIVIHDKATGKSKGYGFVTFKHADSALLSLKEPSKKIDGRVTVTQFASAGLATSLNSSNPNAADVSARKIYVGSVPFDISSDRLLSAFSAYGDIEEGPLGFDKVTGKSKGFAFFVYKAEQGARAALVEPLKNIDGHQVACKLAVDNKKSKPGGAQGTPDNSGVRPPQSSMPPGMYQGVPPQTGPYSGFPGGHQPLPVPSGNNFSGARYNPNLGGGYGMPPPGEFGARLPPSSIGMGPGGYSDDPHYGLGSSMAHPSQHQQPPMPRIPPGGLYQGMPPYY